MLSHDSMTYAARQNMALFGMEYAKETTVSYLPQVIVMLVTDIMMIQMTTHCLCHGDHWYPQSHILGMMMDIYNMIPVGGTCYFADKNALKGTLLENIQHYRWRRITSDN